MSVRVIKGLEELRTLVGQQIGVSEAAAQADAEGIEHHVGDETLIAFARFVKRLEKAPDKGKRRRAQ